MVDWNQFSNSEYHYLKAAFTRLLSTDRFQAMCPLESFGYYWPQGTTLNMKQDAGYKKRKKFFLKENSLTVYSGESASFMGPIFHDLSTCDAGRVTQMSLHFCVCLI